MKDILHNIIISGELVLLILFNFSFNPSSAKSIEQQINLEKKVTLKVLVMQIVY